MRVRAPTSSAMPAELLPQMESGPDEAAQTRWAALLLLLPTALVTLAGVALRVEQYLHGRSLWFDEALLALNVIHRPLQRLLTEPLAYQQGAPPGFLAIQRLVVAQFGSSERMLRLVPMVGGCLTLVVFARLAHRLLSRPAALLATALAAFSPFLVYYAAESKQYSTDVLFTVVILDLAVVLLLRRPGPLQACIFGMAGAVGGGLLASGGVGGRWCQPRGARRVYGQAGLGARWDGWLPGPRSGSAPSRPSTS